SDARGALERIEGYNIWMASQLTFADMNDLTSLWSRVEGDAFPCVNVVPVFPRSHLVNGVPASRGEMKRDMISRIYSHPSLEPAPWDAPNIRMDMERVLIRDGVLRSLLFNPTQIIVFKGERSICALYAVAL